MVSDSTYTPSDRVDLLAALGDPVVFQVWATNDGNVDISDTIVGHDVLTNIGE